MPDKAVQSMAVLKGEEQQIRTVARPTCILCRSEGTETYSLLPDRLFGASGLWNFKTCSNAQCGVMWLDPMPLEEDIGKAYANYHTHTTRDEESPRWAKRFYYQVKRDYQASKYGYEKKANSFFSRNLGKLLYLFPLRRDEADADVRFLPALPHGRLLDVGCGSGEWLAAMQKRRWQVEGVDFDTVATEIARRRRLNVCCGALEEQSYSNASFDAVTMHHVIEHVPNPVQTLAECARILVPGGTLVVSTPNSGSVGHRIFKKHWRGLEPPRHMHVFSMKSLPKLLEQAGFAKVLLRPQIARSVIYESILLRRGKYAFSSSPERNRSAHTLAWLFNLWELLMVKWNPSVADCMTAIATKS